MKYTITSISLLAILFLQSCQHKEEKAPVEDKKFCIDAELKSKIKIDTLTKSPITETLTLTGNVTYNTDNMVQFVSLISGVVTNTYFSLGDYVKKGQVLAEIKSTELNGLQSESRSLQSQLQVAQRQLAATKSMFQDGIASQKDLLSAENDVNVLKSSLENTRENLSLYSASAEKSVFQIKAPTDGYIVEKKMSSGMQISSETESLFTISNLNEVWVMVNIYATNMQNIKENMEVKIKMLAYPDETFTGKISSLSNVFDSEERVLKARIVMKNPNLKLKPGMSADIIIDKEISHEQAIAVPNKAVIFDDNRNYLLFYKDDCNLEIREVEPSAKNDEVVYFDKGIQENEKIITKNQLLIYERLKN
ncbi:efflux RND transporter periplasmic adaptor subunit [Flavobacterium sp. '19STA2R22 D10 B1']|uniref:efflux RND transporter periplasmic adaptor subunit n=1 Tax=Flavobacterium aerium TaxID=3037261 RepID=UPI00278BC9D0|nr:efflux RND transporter periplasmic adaptor subunit [Flavobacterium sp. '19STA2R22 D10 B1']